MPSAEANPSTSEWRPLSKLFVFVRLPPVVTIGAGATQAVSLSLSVAVNLSISIAIAVDIVVYSSYIY